MQLARFHYAFLLLAALALPASLFAQGQIFDNCDQWAAATCGNIVGSGVVAAANDETVVPFESSVSYVGFPDTVYQKSEQLTADGWSLGYEDANDPEGEPVSITFFEQPFEFSGVAHPFSIFVLSLDPENDFQLNLQLDPAAGPFQGICLDYFNSIEADFQINLYNGSLLLETIEVDRDQPSDTRQSFGYLNTEQLDVTRIEFRFVETGDFVLDESVEVDCSDIDDDKVPVDDPDAEEPEDCTDVERLRMGTLLFDIQVAFCEDLPPVEATCYEQLETLVNDIGLVADASDGRDARYYNAAAACSEYMQYEAFWDDDFDRLSRYGGSLFIGGAYTIAYLERVDDPQSDVLIDELLDVLDCIVNREIDYAIDNGGEACLIERAEDFADLADIIDEDFDNQVVATLAYKLAWLNAFYSTY